MNSEIDLGAIYQGEGRCLFRVWAPNAGKVEVHLVSPEDRLVRLNGGDRGYYSATIEEVKPGTLYFFRIDGRDGRPDPASRFQPRGVHGPSQVIDENFAWEDARWAGVSLRDYIIYELHVGTFTPEGTFESAIPRLAELKDLGITNIEIMPVSQFPGGRNWGYDGVLPFAAQNSYGGPEGFKKLINACHKEGLSVTLDVVYNHFGPEGNYLRDFGPYFTGKYKTPWGDAINFDDEYSDEVRHYFIQNAIYWLKHFHVDALRLDAVHAIYDLSAVPFLEELTQNVEALSVEEGRKRYLIAESDLNDSRLIRPRKLWGFGLDAQWSDDFHHSLHSLLTGETEGYYADFGKVGDLVDAINDRYVYAWRYSPFRKRRHGNSSEGRPPEQFVVAIQNHDQIGNRMLGDRISTLVDFESQKLAAGVLLLSPYVPLIFMGEEYSEDAPFLYFVSHTDPELVEAVRKGRKEEFSHFVWKEDPPDPESEETFEKSKLKWEKREEGNHNAILALHKALIRLRREIPALAVGERNGVEARGFEERKLMAMRRRADAGEVLCIFNFNAEDVAVAPGELRIEGKWRSILDSSEESWAGPGSLLPKYIGGDDVLKVRARSFAVYAGC